MTRFEELIREESESICDVLNCYMAKNGEQITGELSISSRDSLDGRSHLRRVISAVRTVLLILMALVFYYCFMPRII
ncbi:hypothetical protein [Desulfosporosinus acidiphilus]|uniref:hypothetical protein n=1 Tax=Desulfosporosinus acidiphilus TaxID=885581 RepID=UPI00059CCDCC|nr:hypothetical protein [Desulfosporosinus acidiphilus]